MHPQSITPPIPIHSDRFWSKVDRTGTGCWLWLASLTGAGYGQFWLNGRREGAHRVAWELTYGPIPDGLLVCHDCPDGDNPRCVNPAHLFLGTTKDNADDMVAKGRGATGDKAPARRFPERVPRGDDHWSRQQPGRRARGAAHGAYTHPESRTYGERNGTAKLTRETVAEIRRLYTNKAASQDALAAQFGVSQTTIGRVVRGELWQHVG